jgi:hypothetical protein
MSYNKLDYINDINSYRLPDDERIIVQQQQEATLDKIDSDLESILTDKGLYLLKITEEINHYQLLDKISLTKIVKLLKRYKV